MNRLAKPPAGFVVEGEGFRMTHADGCSCKVVPARLTDPKDKGWVAVACREDGSPMCGNYFPSFKKLVESLTREVAVV